MTWLERKEQCITNIEELQKYFFYFSDDDNIDINTLMETLSKLPEDNEGIDNIEKEILKFQTQLNRVKSIYKYPYYLIKPSTVVKLGDAFRKILQLDNSAATLGNMLSKLTSEGGYYQSLYNAYIDGTLSGMINIDTSAPIRDFAFYNFSEITGVSAPSATGIGKSAFVGCTGLTTFYAPEAKAYDESFDKAESLVFTDFTAGFDLKKIDKNKITYETWLSTGGKNRPNPGFTKNEHLINLTLTGVKAIGQQAFEECTNLKTVNLTRPDLEVEVKVKEEGDDDSTITTSLVTTEGIGSSAFKNCSSLESVSAPYFRMIYNNAFENCLSLTEASFPRVTEIKNNGFKKCTSLTKISMPLCKTVAANAFEGVSTLESINMGLTTIPNMFSYSKQKSLHTVIMSSATDIVENAFAVTLPSDSTANLSAYESYLTYCYAPALKKIQKKAFYNCINLPALLSPAVSEVYQQAFANCSTLQFVNVAQCKDIKEQAFLSCSNLENLICPSLISIGKNALQECIKLSNLYIPSCKSLGDNPFNGLEGLKYLCIGEDNPTEAGFKGCRMVEWLDLQSCTQIKTSAFKGYGSLKYISIPQCTKIEADAFVEAAQLKRIYLPSVSTIGNNAFKGCTSLSQVYLLNSNVVVPGTTPFETEGINFYVPENLLDSYKDDKENNPWANYKDLFVPIASYSSILVYDKNKICEEIITRDPEENTFDKVGVGREKTEDEIELTNNYITGFNLKVPFYKQEIQAINEASLRDLRNINFRPGTVPNDVEAALIDDENYYTLINIKVDKDTTYRLPKACIILELDKDKNIIKENYHQFYHKIDNDIRYEFRPKSQSCQYICASFKKDEITRDKIKLWSIRDYDHKCFYKIDTDNKTIKGPKFVYVHEDEKDSEGKIRYYKGSYKEEETIKYLYKSLTPIQSINEGSVVGRIDFDTELSFFTPGTYYFIDEDRGPNNNFVSLLNNNLYNGFIIEDGSYEFNRTETTRSYSKLGFISLQDYSNIIININNKSIYNYQLFYYTEDIDTTSSINRMIFLNSTSIAKGLSTITIPEEAKTAVLVITENHTEQEANENKDYILKNSSTLEDVLVNINLNI